jgi:hypothetical protein
MDNLLSEAPKQILQMTPASANVFEEQESTYKTSDVLLQKLPEHPERLKS